MWRVVTKELEGTVQTATKAVLAWRIVAVLSVGLCPMAVLAEPVTTALQPAAEAQQAEAMPPTGSVPVVRTIQIAFPAQGNVPSIEPSTYLFYIETRPSRPSEDVWLEYDEERVIDDFRNLWATGFLDDLSIEYNDEPYPNGVVGRNIIYNMEERERVRIVEFIGSDELDRTKIEEMLVQAETTIQLDTFIDTGLIKKAKTILQVMLAEEGHHSPVITHTIEAVAGGPKRVRLTFNIEDGPETRIREIVFAGNEEQSDRVLRGQMKANKVPMKIWPLNFFFRRGTFKEHRFAEDADGIIQHYRRLGYVRAQVGQPELTTLEDSGDGNKRYVRMRIPVSEGVRYRIGELTFEGVEIMRQDAVRRQFDIDEGDYYNEKVIRDGIERAQMMYGASGYMEFVAFPDLSLRDQVQEDDGSIRRIDAPPIVDVTIRVEEGEQYFVGRIDFSGNTTTRDKVVRRELRVFEGGVFNTEMLKISVRRLNQLGYFIPLEEDAVDVEKSEEKDNEVNLNIPLEEQNRNEITFGMGYSEWDGFFGQLSFGTSNFIGRGETLNLSLQHGQWSKNYVIGFTEPFLFDRNIAAGFSVYKTKLNWIGQFTQSSMGANLNVSKPIAMFTRMSFGYAYERSKVSDLAPAFSNPRLLQYNPYLTDSLLLGTDGARTVSKWVPGIIHNTIDHPIFPSAGKRIITSLEFAGPGGNTKFYKPRLETIFYVPHTPGTSFGFRLDTQYIKPIGDTTYIPLFERIYLGGEYSIRGFDLRTVGPRDEASGLVLGGTKSVLLSAEYLITLAQPVRLVLFYDTGQVQGTGVDFTYGDFKTSTGAEIRFLMPVMNVPMRLIFAYNPQRSGVLDNNFRPEGRFNFRFAVGAPF